MSSVDFSKIYTALEAPKKEQLAYPFSYILGDGEKDEYNEMFSTSDFAKGILGEEKCECGNFPHNIVEFYWIHEGQNDEEPWECLCKLDNGNYAFYTASCDYTGFDCQGGMSLIVSGDREKLFNEGMSDGQRERCLIDKGLKKKAKKEWKPSAALAEKMKSTTAPKATAMPKATTMPKATEAEITVWHNDIPLSLEFDNLNGLEFEALEYAIRGLTAKFLTPKPKDGKSSAPPKKEFYEVNCWPDKKVKKIDEAFKKRFADPEKKWQLRMKDSADASVSKWGKVEVSFRLC
jgi:hypothetical protein